MRKEQKVSIIILNWNKAGDTIKCLNSFSQLQYPNYELIVVDNASTEDFTQQMGEKFPGITLLRTGCNLGYTGGNNFGIRYAIENGAGYVLIVNNDTELVNPHFLQEVIKKMEDDPSIGIIGPKVLNPGGRVQDTILSVPTLFNCLKESFGLQFGTRKSKDCNISQQVEAVSGVCWLIKKKVMEDIGLLDEDYFMYAEEQDYCYRAQKANWKIVYYPTESILHYKELDDKNKERKYRQYIYVRRNLVLFLRKHFGFCHALLLASLFLWSSVLKVVFCKLTRKEKSFYNSSILSALIYEFKYVLCDRWKRANKYSL